MKYHLKHVELLIDLNKLYSDVYLMFIGPCIIVITEDKKPTRCHLLFYCTSYRLNMFWDYYAHPQELATVMLITTLVVSFSKDGGGSVNVNLCFLVVFVQCEVLCPLVVAGNVFLLILIVVIFYAL